MKKAKLIDARTGLFECPTCGHKWQAQVKPDSGGKFYRGSRQCPHCKGGA